MTGRMLSYFQKTFLGMWQFCPKIIWEKFDYLMCPPLSFSHHHIEINFTDNRHFVLVYLLGITRLMFTGSTAQEPPMYDVIVLMQKYAHIWLTSVSRLLQGLLLSYYGYLVILVIRVKCNFFLIWWHQMTFFTFNT